MDGSQTNIDTLRDIRSIMERSSRFISLSGWSGISAGMFGLAGAWVANNRINDFLANSNAAGTVCPTCLRNELLVIALIVFAFAFVSAILFTVARSRRENVPVWGVVAKRLLWNTLMPMLVGGIVIYKLLSIEQYDLIVPSALIFYGLALVNGSKYTMGEVRYLGYAQIATGVISLFIDQSGLYFFAFGFGILHIIYGIVMWLRHERNN